MDDPAPESMSSEELLRRLRGFCDKLRPCAANLRELGMDVDTFLEACERLIAFLEGRSDEGEDVPGVIEKINAFHNEMRGFYEIMRQAERINLVVSIPGLVDEVEEISRGMTHPDDARTAAALRASVEAARQRLARGEVPVEELQDISISTHAQTGELRRRNHFRVAAVALFWESRPPEWWAKLTAAERQELEELLASWRADREKILGELPIEDRRRLEALRPEDFDKPGALDP